MFDTAAQETDLRSKCFSVDIQPTLCTYNETDAIVRARNMAGEAEFIGFVIDGPTGATVNSSRQSAGPLLGTVSDTYMAVYTSGDVRDLTVAGVVRDDANNEETCPGTTIACVYTGAP